MRRILTSLLLLLGVSIGCSDESNRLPPQAQTAVAGLSTPQGPYPRGQVSAANILDPATQGPEITVLSPARGAQVSSGTITVEVQVSDPNGIGTVTIDGFPATPGSSAPTGSGSLFTAQVPLTPGVNHVAIASSDLLGNQAQACFAVVEGQFRPQDEYMQYLGAGFSRIGLSRLGSLVSAQAASLDLNTQLQAQNPLVTTSQFNINVLGFRHGPPRVDLAGEPNGLLVSVLLPQVEVELQAEIFGLNVLRITMLADQLTADFHAEEIPPGSPPPAQSLLGKLVINQVDVNFVNFRLLNSVALLDRVLENALRSQLPQILNDAVYDLLNNQPIPAIDTPLAVNVPIPSAANPSRVELQASLLDLEGTSAGDASLLLGSRTTAPQPFYAPGTSRGVLISTTPPVPVVQAGDSFVLGITEESLNGMLHALWEAGGIRLVVDGTLPPTGPQSLIPSARLLYPFFPQAEDLAPDPDTPLVIELTSETPPVALLGQNGHSIEFHAGELQVRISIDYMDGGPRLELFTVRAPIGLGVDASVTNGNLIQIDKLTVAQVCADLISEPAADLADKELEDFLNQSLPFLIDRFKDQLPAFPIPALPLGVQLFNPRIEALPGVLIVRGGL